MNKIMLIGNLTRDPETSTTNSGHVLCRFGIAVSRNFPSANGERETDFFNITAWRQLGETCAKYLEKGKKVAVSGTLQIRTYDAQDGTRRTNVDVTAEEVEFLSPKSSDSFEPKSAPTQRGRAQLQEVEDDGSLPF